MSADPTPSKPLTFAVVSGLVNAEAYLADLCKQLESALARPVAGSVLRSYTALEQEVEAGRADIVWAPPRVAIDLEDGEFGAIELCCTRGGGLTDYHAALFTRHAAPFEKLADLQGSHAAWVDRSSMAGYLLPRMKLVAEGFKPDKLFGKQSFLGTHAAVAKAVLEGEADVGATYLHLDRKTGRPVSAGWLDAGAGINGAFILAQAGPIPSDAIVIASGIPEEERRAIVEQLVGAPAAVPEAVGRLLGADGFAPPDKKHFEALRVLLATGKKW